MITEDFTLHPQLAADCLVIGDWPLCRLLRMNDRTYPWLILVPRVANARDLIDLSDSDQVHLTREIAQASTALRRALGCDKLNVAALGNVVPQLHLHVVGRFTTDAAWPKPIWGVVPPVAMTAGEAATDLARWRDLLKPAQ